MPAVDSSKKLPTAEVIIYLFGASVPSSHVTVVGKGFSSSVPVISTHGQCDALGVNEPKPETYDKSIVPPPETITSKTLAVAISLSTINECPAPDSTIIPSPSKGVPL